MIARILGRLPADQSAYLNAAWGGCDSARLTRPRLRRSTWCARQGRRCEDCRFERQMKCYLAGETNSVTLAPRRRRA
uniref:Uncharacterized protein n=1 Tax=viral metagenome TaxID=1070528 RepID=A0A6M3KLD3_9ZZZZ